MSPNFNGNIPEGMRLTSSSNSMLKLAAEKGIKPILDEILPMKEAAKAVEKVKTNHVRYRFVLKQDLA